MGSESWVKAWHCLQQSIIAKPPTFTSSTIFFKINKNLFKPLDKICILHALNQENN